jgi:hypothetical protein
MKRHERETLCFKNLSKKEPSPLRTILIIHTHTRVYVKKTYDGQQENYRAKTLTTPSPPALTTSLPSLLQQTSHTPSPLIARCDTMSCVQILFSSDQKRMLASWPAETASRPSMDRQRAEMADGWASMV